MNSKKLLILLLVLISPVCFGLTKPSLYMTRGLESLTTTSLAAIAAGEHVAISTALTATENATFPAEIYIHFTPGGSITVPGTVTLALSGHIIAEPEHIFKGTGNVIFYGADNAVVSPHWWGAVGDGSTDDSAAIQRCIDAVRLSYRVPVNKRYRPVIQFLARTYVIGTTLDVGNGSRSLSMRGVIRGEDYGTVLQGMTGDGTPIIDAVGAHGLTVEDMVLYLSRTSSGSGIGILVGFGTAGDGAQCKFSGLYINAANDITKNSSAGTIGIFNVMAEHSTYIGCSILANAPIIISNLASCSAFLPGSTGTTFIASSTKEAFNVTQLSGGVHKFEGQNILLARGEHRPGLTMRNAYAIDLGTTYIGEDISEGTVGTYSTAIAAYGVFSLTANGVCAENMGTFIEAFALNGSDITGLLAGTNASATARGDPVIRCITTGELIGNCINIYVSDATKPWFAWSSPSFKMMGNSFTSSNYLSTITLASDTPQWYCRGNSFWSFSQQYQVGDTGEITMSGDVSAPPSTTGIFSSVRCGYIHAPASWTTAGVTGVQFTGTLLALAGAEAACRTIVGSAPLAFDSSGNAHPAPYIYVYGWAPETTTNAEVISIGATSLLVVPNTAGTGWYYEFSTTLGGSAASTATVEFKYKITTTNLGYGYYKPVPSISAP